MATLRIVRGLSQKLFLRSSQHAYGAMRYRSDEIKFNVDLEKYHDADYPELRGIIPDPYPKTKEEHERSAAKYNLHPDEYKPCPDDHRYCGDYPDLPEIGAAAKDPYYPWDLPQSRRNYGEPLPARFHLLGQDRFGFGPRQYISDEKGALYCILCFVAAFALYYIAPSTSQPVLKKQYPGQGEHYTFELAGNTK